jgi:hypothetical protein
MCVYLAWLWSMGSYLHSILPPSSRIKIASFRFTLIYPAVYAVGFLVFFDRLDSPQALGIILPPHLFAMLCMLHQRLRSSIMQGRFFLSGFSRWGFGLFSQRSIGFTQIERMSSHAFRRPLRSAKILNEKGLGTGFLTKVIEPTA